MVAMTIYYKDIIGLNIRGMKLCFKLPRSMVLFLKDFDPSNSNHEIIIELGSMTNVDMFKSKVAHLIR